MFHFFQSRSIE